jgi:predicted nucleic acid-binding protein
MITVFADTWFFVASLHKFDNGHVAAKRLSRRFGDAIIVTHDAVLTEVLTFFSGHGSFWRERAAQAVRGTTRAPNYQVIPWSRRLFESSLDLYEQRRDKEYSLVDCGSMQVMRNLGIRQVLTNDHHFAQEGFVVLSDAP